MNNTNGNLRADSLIDINHATLEEFVSVPGIGKALAARIIASRPYIALDELQLVSGIGSHLMDKIRPYLTLSLPSSINGGTGGMEPDRITDSAKSTETAVIARPSPRGSPDIIELPASIGGQDSRQTEDQYLEPGDKEQLALHDSSKMQMVPVNRSETDDEKAPSQHTALAATGETETFKRSQIILLTVGLSFLSFLLAVIISIGIIGLVNRSLVYVPAAQFDLLNHDIDALASRVDLLDEDLEDLRIRMDTYENISGRVKSLEQDNETIQQDIENNAARLEDIEAQLVEIDGQITDIEQRSKLLDIFLKGLRDLLFNLPEMIEE